MITTHKSRWGPWLLAWTLWMLPGSALAGSLGDFADSHRSSSGGSSSSSDGGSFDVSGVDHEPSELESLIYYWIFMGNTPGYGYSFGSHPYDERRHLERVYQVESSLIGIDDPKWAFHRGQVERAEYGLLQVRAEGLVTPTGDAVGWGAFAKLSSTFTPALVVWQMEAYERDARQALGFGQALIEPRILMHEKAILSWNGGVNWLYDEEEVLGVGPSLGLALEVTPIKPVLIEARLSTHFPAGVATLDTSLQAGAQLVGPMALRAGWRRLAIRDGATLDMFSLSLGLDWGF